MDEKNQAVIPAEIREFLESLLQEAKILTLDENNKEHMIQELFYQLDNYLTSVIVDSLQPDDLEEFIKMNEDKKSKEEIEGFIKEKLPDAENIFTDAFIKFKDMYLQNAAEGAVEATSDDSQSNEKPF